MKKSRYSDNQILSILKQAEAGTPVSELWREGLLTFTIGNDSKIYNYTFSNRNNM